jgi:hypothetical protein
LKEIPKKYFPFQEVTAIMEKKKKRRVRGVRFEKKEML